MTCQKDENVGLDLPKSLFPVNIRYAATVGFVGSNSRCIDAPGVIVQTSDITLYSTLNWS